MVVADPLSLAGFTTSTTILERSDLGWADAVRDHDQCVERSRWEGRLPVPLPRHRQDLHRP